MGILMCVYLYRESPGKFDSRTLNRKSLSRWTGRIRVKSTARRGAVCGGLTQGALCNNSSTTRFYYICIYIYIYMFIYTYTYLIHIYIYIYIYIWRHALFYHKHKLHVMTCAHGTGPPGGLPLLLSILLMCMFVCMFMFMISFMSMITFMIMHMFMCLLMIILLLLLIIIIIIIITIIILITPTHGTGPPAVKLFNRWYYTWYTYYIAANTI